MRWSVFKIFLKSTPAFPFPTWTLSGRISVFSCYKICGFSSLLQGMQTVIVERKGSIIIHPVPCSVLVIPVGWEALNLAVLMPCCSTELQRNHSCSRLWEKAWNRLVLIDSDKDFPTASVKTSCGLRLAALFSNVIAVWKGKAACREFHNALKHTL